MNRRNHWKIKGFVQGAFACLLCLPLFGASAFAARGRPHLDTSLGFNMLLSDNDTLLRGVSLSWDGGDPYGTLAKKMPSQASLNALAEEYGLNTVHLYLEGDSTGNTNPIGYNAADCDILVQRCANAGLYLIITIGCNGENGTMDLAWSLDFWNFYAPRYANDTHVIYEAHNEPVAYTPGHWTAEDWDNQVVLYNAIRAAAPNTFILLGSFMSFSGGSAITGADNLASQGVDWSNAGFSYHGYTGLTSIESAIEPFKTSTTYPALLCTEFWPGDTQNGYNSAFESHFNGWMQFQWLAGFDEELPDFAWKIDQAGTVWTPDVATCNWPAKGTLDIPSSGSLVGIYYRGDDQFVSGNGDLKADLSTYTGSQNDAFIIEDAGPHLVSLKAANGLYVSTTGEGDTLTADASSVGNTEKFEFYRLSNGDVTLRAYGGGGHLPATASKGKNNGKFLPSADDQLVPASNFALVDGTAPTGPPPPPEDPTEPNPPGPFYGTPQAIPGVIVAGDFDYGGEGVAYHDSDTGNNGGAYRPTEDVDIEIGSEGINVAWISSGEWMDYTVDVASAGTYTITARVAFGPGTFHMEFDGVDQTGPIDVAYTGGYQDWVDVSAVVTLAAGEQIMTFYHDSGSINLRQFDITSGGTTNPPSGDGVVYVDNIAMTTSTAGGNRTEARAIVTILDDAGSVVSGASVSGQWSGLTSDSDTGTTDGSGNVTLTSSKVRNANGTYTFTVTGVTASGMNYNSALNQETSDAIVFP